MNHFTKSDIIPVASILAYVGAVNVDVWIARGVGITAIILATVKIIHIIWHWKKKADE